MIVPMKEILVSARANRFAVAALSFWSLDSAQAAMEAADEAGMPVILQTGQLESEFAGFENLARIVRMVAENSPVRTALHLDHGGSIETAKIAIDNGFTSVMIDASHLPYRENVAITQRVVELSSPYGVTVESELGRLSGSEAGKTVSQEENTQTDPEEAQKFVSETGIDALAVAIGTGHGFYKQKPKLNLKKLEEISEKVKIPLVLHGGSDTPDDQVLRAIGLGVAKVNICTEFIAAFGKAYICAQAAAGFKYSVPSLFGAGKDKGKELALAKIRLFANKAV